jgi:hypothetical protein
VRKRASCIAVLHFLLPTFAVNAQEAGTPIRHPMILGNILSTVRTYQGEQSNVNVCGGNCSGRTMKYWGCSNKKKCVIDCSIEDNPRPYCY